MIPHHLTFLNSVPTYLSRGIIYTIKWLLFILSKIESILFQEQNMDYLDKANKSFTDGSKQ